MVYTAPKHQTLRFRNCTTRQGEFPFVEGLSVKANWRLEAEHFVFRNGWTLLHGMQWLPQWTDTRLYSMSAKLQWYNGRQTTYPWLFQRYGQKLEIKTVCQNNGLQRVFCFFPWLVSFRFAFLFPSTHTALVPCLVNLVPRALRQTNWERGCRTEPQVYCVSGNSSSFVWRTLLLKMVRDSIVNPWKSLPSLHLRLVFGRQSGALVFIEVLQVFLELRSLWIVSHSRLTGGLIVCGADEQICQSNQPRGLPPPHRRPVGHRNLLHVMVFCVSFDALLESAEYRSNLRYRRYTSSAEAIVDHARNRSVFPHSNFRAVQLACRLFCVCASAGEQWSFWTIFQALYVFIVTYRCCWQTRLLFSPAC